MRQMLQEEVGPLAENDSQEVVEKKESVEGEKDKPQDKAGGSENVDKMYPANKYELAIVAAQEARRMNEGWKEDQETPGLRVTEKALDKVRNGDVRYTMVDEEGN